jgi:mRNA interferase RelE/StbE
VSYVVLVGTRATKDLDDLPTSVQRRVRALIDGLATEPRPRGAQALAGLADSYRLRAGDYRVVYAVDDAERQVVIARVGHRRDMSQRL